MEIVCNLEVTPILRSKERGILIFVISGSTLEGIGSAVNGGMSSGGVVLCPGHYEVTES